MRRIVSVLVVAALMAATLVASTLPDGGVTGGLRRLLPLRKRNSLFLRGRPTVRRRSWLAGSELRSLADRTAAGRPRLRRSYRHHVRARHAPRSLEGKLCRGSDDGASPA